MQLFKYVTLTLRQQHHPDDVLLPPTGKQIHLSKGPIKKRNEEKNMNLSQNCYMGKHTSMTLTLSQGMSDEWGWYRIKSYIKSYNP